MRRAAKMTKRNEEASANGQEDAETRLARLLALGAWWWWGFLFFSQYGRVSPKR